MSARGEGRGGQAEVDPASVSAPQVPASEYDVAYYLHTCAGYDTWVNSGGAEADPMYRGCLEKAALRAGDFLVDVGTGRGETVTTALEMGASFAIGVEYSIGALELARKTLASSADPTRGAVVAADARLLPLPDGVADLVTMLDVVEHLSPSELDDGVREARRVLKPGGRLFIHTFPTKTIYNVTYRLQRLAVPGRRRRWPADPRNEYEHSMHVNEQTRRSLRGTLARCGFDTTSVTYGSWIWDGMVPDAKAKLLYARLARFRLTAGLGRADLWAEAVKPA